MTIFILTNLGYSISDDFNSIKFKWNDKLQNLNNLKITQMQSPNTMEQFLENYKTDSEQFLQGLEA